MGPCPYRHGVAALTASAVRVVSESRFCVCPPLSNSAVNEEVIWVTNVRWFRPVARGAAPRSRLDAEDRVPRARLPRACCWAGRHEGHHTVAVQKSQAKLQEVGSRQPMHCKLSVHGRRCVAFCGHTAHGTRHTPAHRPEHAVDAPRAHPWTATCTPTAHDRGVMHVPTW